MYRRARDTGQEMRYGGQGRETGDLGSRSAAPVVLAVLATERKV